MRIISGSAKGKRLLVPNEGTRPSTDRAREALFNVLSHLIEDAKVLDLYAGSGAFAIESLSRGAAMASCVESDRRACSVIRKNYKNANIVSLSVIQSEVLHFLKTAVGSYDLVFADPPYDDHFLGSQLERTLHSQQLCQITHAQSYLITESPDMLGKEQYGCWQVADRRKYGISHYTIFTQI